MRDDLFNEKRVSQIKEYTKADEKLILETKNMIASGICDNKSEKISSFPQRIMKLSVACVAGLVCGILAYQVAFKGTWKENKAPQNNGQIYVAEDSKTDNEYDMYKAENEQEIPDTENEDAQHIIMAGGTDEKMNIIEEISENGMGDMAFSLDTLEELTQHSEEIIKGTVIDWESSCNTETHVHTKYHVLVEKVYKGSVVKGDIITVLSPGGIVSAKEYREIHGNDSKVSWDDFSDDELKNGYISYMYDGESPVKEGDYCILMLDKFDLADIIEGEEGTVYGPLGNYRGRFIIDSNKIKRYIPKSEDEEIKIDDVKEFEKRINKYL